MSEPACFVVIREGQRRVYGSRWGAAFLFRELAWGCDAFEEFVSAGGELEEDALEYEPAGVVVNHDQQTMLWTGDSTLEHPRIEKLFDQLLARTWKGFTVSVTQDERQFLEAAGVSPEYLEDDEDEESYDPILDGRCQTVKEAVASYDEDEDDDSYDDEDDEDQYSELSWVTLIDADGTARHRKMHEIPGDLLRGELSAIEDVKNLEPCAVLPEKRISEGMWINFGKSEIGYWGLSAYRGAADILASSWTGWDIVWAEQGYRDQCAQAEIPGEPMSDEQALAKIVPVLLTTKKLDARFLVDSIGGSIKGMAIKATGCLMLLLSVPILIFGYFMDAMKAAGISIGVLLLILMVIFKILEGRVRRFFNSAMPTEHPDEEDAAPPTAGPLDKQLRRERLEQILSSAGLPNLASIEPHIEHDEFYDALT